MRLFLLAAAFSIGIPIYAQRAHAWNNHQELFAKNLKPDFGASVDEPDQGMDRDLPDSADPLNERKWMGGSKGFSSQGFRHMYFGGWNLMHPIATFQIPLKAVGQAPVRVEQMAREAQELEKKNDHAEAIRRLGWALHYLQDLAQPFHATQLVHWKMAAWSELLSWPLGRGLDRFIQETTRRISNYHLGLEDYVEYRIKNGDGRSIVEQALKEPERFATLKLNPGTDPRQLALQLAQASTALAPKLGEAEMKFFGEKWLDPGIDLRDEKTPPDFQALAVDPALAPARDELEASIAQALANAMLASRALIDWTLHP